jgi:hypothetical protein
VAAAHLLAAGGDVELRWQGAELKDHLNMVTFATYTPTLIHWSIFSVSTSLVLFRVFWMIDADARKLKAPRQNVQTLIQVIVFIGLLYGVIYWLGTWGAVLLILFFMIFLIASYAIQAEEKFLLESFFSGWQLAFSNFGQVVGLQFILVLMAISLILILYAPLFALNISVVKWNFSRSDVWAQNIIHFVEVFLRVFAFNLMVPVFAATAAYLYASLQEVSQASALKASIARVGARLTRNKVK